MTAELAPQMEAVTQARVELNAAAFAGARDEAAIRAKAEAVHAAELALANARADLFAKVQASPARLTPSQVAALISAGGVFRGAVAAGREEGAARSRTSGRRKPTRSPG